MNKKTILIIAAAAVILIVAFAMGFNKSKMPLQIKQGKISSVSGLLNEAKSLEAKGELLQAKTAYQSLINDFPNSNEVMNWQKKIEDLNTRLLFSPVVTPKSISYQIKPGDTLNKIAKEFNTTVELIKKSNNLSGNKIIPGRKIKVWNTPFSILVDKSQNTLILKTDEEIFKTYIVSTGVNNSTPVGTFKIVNKLENPTWFKAGAVVASSSPENVLGTRWMGWDVPGYGIHGTIEPQNLGKQITQGCVRMANKEVEELYSIVPAGTEVTIVD